MSYHLNKQNYKVVLLGDDNVGKTSLCLKLVKNIFKKDVESTIGVNFFTKNVLHHGNNFKIIFWDTSGHERFRCVIKNYYNVANLYILMFDLSNRKTFDSLSFWLNEIQKYNNTRDYKIIVIGNKKDKLIEVDENLIKNFLSFNNLSLYLNISLKDDLNLYRLENMIYDNLYINPQINNNSYEFNVQSKLLDKDNKTKDYCNCCVIF